MNALARPAVVVNDIPVLSSERVPQMRNLAAV
jgi:hypothetical protein